MAVAVARLRWFTNPGDDTIGRITADGDVAGPIAIQNGPSNPQDIVLGPDGNFWFTEYTAGAISRVTPQGVVERFPINPDPGLAGPRIAVDGPHPVNITVGPDGNLWFTDEGLNKIGRITTSGDIVEFPIPTADSAPAGITAGNGKLFVESNPAASPASPQTATSPSSAPPIPRRSRNTSPSVPTAPSGSPQYDTNRLGRIRPRRPHHPFRPARHRRRPDRHIGRGDGRLFVALLNTSQILYADLAAAEPTHDHTDSDSHANPYATPPYRRSTATSTACHAHAHGHGDADHHRDRAGSTATETPETSTSVHRRLRWR
jgi:hypothetical protein